MDDEANQPEIFNLIFKSINTAGDEISYLFDILNFIAARLEKQETSFSKFELEYFYSAYEQLTRLKDIINSYSGEISAETFRRLVMEVLRSTRIPFTGEPLKGLQVMGLLETRALDFENVFVLSMNEGIMPGGNILNSFIPYSIRKAFKLPTFDEEDAIPAYYLYRLMHRAKNIYLFYNTEVDLFSSGEISRFLLQIENELIKENKNIKYEHAIVTTEITKPFRKEIIIEKTHDVSGKLDNIRFSPSDLTSYINCKLQFYFKKAAGLREEEEIEESFSPATFGSILHNVIEITYNPYKEKTITKEIINSIRKNLNTDFNRILKQAFQKIESLKELDLDLQGKNLLFKNIIKTLVNKILDNDKKDLPFKIIDLEKQIDNSLELEVNKEFKTVKLAGRIDRVDEREGVTTIIDYKTGRFELKPIGKKSLEEYFDLVFTDPRYKENFQGYFYANSYSMQDGINPLKIAIYPLRNVSEGLKYLTEDSVDSVLLAEYDKNLKKMIGEILSPETPFTQTDDNERCIYCPYKSICYRE
jgi:CRISPR/Cas system-associated exonuclease Cas4 (RecB family)